MPIRKLARLLALVVATAGLVNIAQPAYALSSMPDSTWGAKGKVYALAQSGNVMFVGGSFTKALGPSGQIVPAANLMAVDITTGAYISTFTPSIAFTQTTAKVEVDALAVSSDGSTLFIGGSFDTVDGALRQNFAAVDTATGMQVSPIFTASPNLPVNALLAGPNLVYLGGNFLKVNGVNRTHLAAVSTSDGSLSDTWAPSATAGTDPCPTLFPSGTSCGPTSNGGTGHVHSMAFAPDGASIYVGGNFYYMNGVPRNALAKVSATDGSLVDWRVPWARIPSEGAGNPYVGPNVVWAILPTAARLYVAWGRTPNGFTAFTNTTSTAGSGECSNLPMGNGCVTWLWTQGTPGNAESLAISPDGTRLFVGGHFGTGDLDYKLSSCGSNVWAHGLVSANPATGAIFCDWVPQPSPFGGTSAPGHDIDSRQFVGSWAMQMTNNALFVGGFFTKFWNGDPYGPSSTSVPQSGVARFTLVGSPPPPPPVPTITSFTPMSGPVGTAVTVTGTGFTGATAVKFGTIASSSFTVDSDTQITAIVPPGFDKAIIFVTTPGGTAKSVGMNFKVPPSITSFTPTTGSVGTAVTITGTVLAGTTVVRFGTIAATSFTVDSDTQVTAIVPSGFTQAAVKVTTGGGTATSGVNFVVT